MPGLRATPAYAFGRVMGTDGPAPLHGRLAPGGVVIEALLTGSSPRFMTVCSWYSTESLPMSLIHAIACVPPRVHGGLHLTVATGGCNRVPASFF
jgi:hypothetical protein